MFKKSKYKYYHDIIECLVSALEAKDLYTRGHSDRVAQMATDIASVIGFKGERLEKIHIAGHLHDIGKIGISDSILNKTGKLTLNEYEIMKKHSEIGYEIIRKSEELKDIAVIVRHHHEAYDGSGYPDELKGDDIPLESRILAISDAIDAMTSHRLYREKVSFVACRQEIERCSGKQFDPWIVNSIGGLWDKWATYNISQDSHDPIRDWCSNL